MSLRSRLIEVLAVVAERAVRPVDQFDNTSRMIDQALHSCSESSAVERGEGQMGNVGFQVLRPAARSLPVYLRDSEVVLREYDRLVQERTHVSRPASS